ncbi:methyltransferase family protein [Streptococcus macacae]|uniref:Isoprenylcysteine carboxyl methyltransferase domain protein n=1 Tax=Streptococcus macacae NCTC 11558 TaxID=764298 RepID=G5JZ93_9STRE|nr:methyltransferase [Streptococcus macacae]EHJ52366.1 isoprenylcysteine carboxyl methyltransferase domain protein [Streptococcus macacae NCTC 11558]SUN78342.1 isoprenylcysteine carboxyl methyltransferase [Streptococcus macacae NCTC 11558]
MLGFFLWIPFLLIRFPFMAHFSRKALPRAAYFAPVQGKEKIAYLGYQISNLALFLPTFFTKVDLDFSWFFYLGLFIYLLGLLLCAVCVAHFAKPDDKGMNTQGIYRFSRHPMYLAYFICFLGMAMLLRSIPFVIILILFQLSAHWIILAEERWCLVQFGSSYQDYMKQVRRYI